jgi:uncharacterized ferritin-like protein (DUF455 family)
MTIRHRALQALSLCNPEDKCRATHELRAMADSLDWGTGERITAPASTMLPGRPDQPPLVSATEVPRRSPFTDEGLAAMAHAIAHIEFNAINLALDAVWRFEGMPEAFYRDWLRVADEEAHHFALLNAALQDMGWRYGDFPAHDGLWSMCLKTQDDITARMALVPRTLEARGLDATPLIQAKLRQVGSPAALRLVSILDLILREEIGHVAIGNHWYAHLCQQQGIEPLAHYRQLSRTHAAPRLRPPLNDAARLAAGFSQVELDYLLSA